MAFGETLESSTPRRIPLQLRVHYILPFTEGACQGEQFSNVSSGASGVEPDLLTPWQKTQVLDETKIYYCAPR